VNDDVATDARRDDRAERRRREVTLAGHRGDEDAARRGLADGDPGVRAAALGALARLGALTTGEVVLALADESPAVRRRAVEAALEVRGKGSRSVLPAALTDALADPDPLVAVGAAWFVGERRSAGAVPGLVVLATQHDDARCREAAVAALGAIGDPAGLDAVLAALADRPTVRRRATVALAGFDDPRTEPALREAASDRDWQVRQAADELLDYPAGDHPGAAAPPDDAPLSRPR
jgi:HEAT repeat protein